MVEEVLQYMTQYHMVEPGDVVITGVSGGADSVCLLLVLQKLAAELSISIEAVHINHGIRTEAAGDSFSSSLCRCGDTGKAGKDVYGRDGTKDPI